MNRTIPTSTLKTLAILLALLWSSPSSLLGYQRAAKTGKKPQTSSDSSFVPEKLSKLAVIVVRGGNPREIQTDQQRLVEDEFMQTLLQKGYSLVSRSDIQAVVKEREFQRSGLTEENAAAVGKLLNVPAVMVLRITECTAESQRDPRSRLPIWVGRASLSARLISVESGSIWWTGNHRETGVVRGRGEAPLVLADVAKNIAAAFPDKGPSNSVASAGSFDPKSLSKLAIVVVGTGTPRRNAMQSEQQRLVEDEFVQILMQKGYSLVSRSDIQALVKEQEFQKSGLTEDNAAAVGKLLNVPAVMVLRINECTVENQRSPRTGAMVLVGRATVGARLVSVESGLIPWTRSLSESHTIGGRSEVSSVLSLVARNIANTFPDKNGEKKATSSKPDKKTTKG